MSGSQAFVVLIVLGTPFWIPFMGYPLQWACRLAKVTTPDFNRALQISFAEMIAVVSILTASALAYYCLAIDFSTSPGLVGLLTAGVAVGVPVGVYIPMMRVTYLKALWIALMRYAFTLALPTGALLLLLCLVGIGNLLAR
jgi:hypothetical protein